jgi:L-aspartate oxidase
MASSSNDDMIKCDVAIVGSGLGGLTVALHLAKSRRVLLIAKRELTAGATAWAQGGIAAVLESDDSNESHVQDTLAAGAGLCDEAATRVIIGRSSEAIEWLIDLGVPFTRDSSTQRGFHLTREGGHSHRRIIHAADATGRALHATLLQAVRSNPSIRILEHHTAIDLITSETISKIGKIGPARCFGLHVFDQQSGRVRTVVANQTVLATGGAGKVYLYTSNPDTATGDGIAMAWRAGCRVANMEFIQFHPTCLYHPHAKSFLISEAVRGEGGLLVLPVSAGAAAGQRFMPEHDPRAELAPRDIVARAIDFEMKKRGLDHVDLDISHQPAAFLQSHFPNILARCKELGIDITSQPIPVVPAAHYTCGGIVTDMHGQADLDGLYAVGETSYTGLHGANRLASNSLLECLVMGRAAARHIDSQPAIVIETLPRWKASRGSDPEEAVVISNNWDELRRTMWNYVGIIRSTRRLNRAHRRIRLLQSEIGEYYRRFSVTSDLIELRNLLQVASLIVQSALARHESRGLHQSSDFPDALPQALPTVLSPPGTVSQSRLLWNKKSREPKRPAALP